MGDLAVTTAAAAEAVAAAAAACNQCVQCGLSVGNEIFHTDNTFGLVGRLVVGISPC